RPCRCDERRARRRDRPVWPRGPRSARRRSEEHTSELQSRENLVCRLLLEKKHLGRRDGHSGLREVRSRRCPRADPDPGLFFNDTATTEIYALSLLDALPISAVGTS